MIDELEGITFDQQHNQPLEEKISKITADPKLKLCIKLWPGEFEQIFSNQTRVAPGTHVELNPGIITVRNSELYIKN